MDTLKGFLFGVPRFEYGGVTIPIPRRKSVALVAYLALNPRSYNRQMLAALLWPSLDDAGASSALRSALYTLTSRFQKTLFNQDRQLLSLDASHIWIDVWEFRATLRNVRSHAHLSDSVCEECIRQFLSAVELYQGDFLSGFTLDDCAEYEQWQLFQRETLRREYGGMLMRLAEFYGNDATHEYDLAIHYAQRWLALDRLHEPAHRLLMRMYATSRQPDRAIRQYHDCVAILNAELLTPPEEATTLLFEKLRKQSGSTLNRLAVSIPGGSVLPPLPTVMIGREKALSDLKNRLGIGQNSRLQLRTVIQGLPGVGKSTLMASLTHDREIHQAFHDGVLWTSLGEIPNLTTELLTWAKVFGLIDPGISYELGEITALLTAALRNKHILLIVDDIWRIADAAPFRVGGQNSAMVLSTRLNDVAEALAPTARDIYRLPVLTEIGGLQLLKTIVPDVVVHYPNKSRVLVHALQGLPLAIQVAGRLLRDEMKFGWGVTDLLADLQEGTRLLEEQVPGDMIGPWQSITPTVAALLHRSTDGLDDLTRQRFADLGFFVPKPATFDLKAMSALWQTDDVKPTARILINRGLLEPVSGGRFQMHALLILHARSLKAAKG